MPDYRRPWYHRWAGLLGEPRRRWRSLDDKQRRRANAVLKVVLVLVVLYISWPLGVLVAVLFGANYLDPYIPERASWSRRALIPTIIGVIAITYPFYNASLADMKLFGAYPDVNTAVIMGVYVIMAIGLNIVVGYAGLLDLGYVAFYAMGAYTCAWFASVQFANHKIHFGATGVASTTPGIHINIWLLVLIAGILTAFIGILIGLPTLRLRGDYLAIVTLGFGEIIRVFMNNLDHPVNITNGPKGLNQIDSIHFWGLNLGKPLNLFGYEIASVSLYYYLFLALVVGSVLICYRLENSRIGRAWMAIREDEIAAKAMGINCLLYTSPSPRD